MRSVVRILVMMLTAAVAAGSLLESTREDATTPDRRRSPPGATRQVDPAPTLRGMSRRVAQIGPAALRGERRPAHLPPMPDRWERMELADALQTASAYARQGSYAELLRILFSARDVRVRMQVIRALAERFPVASRDHLVQLAREGASSKLRCAALRALGVTQSDVAGVLGVALDEGRNRAERAAAAEGLARLGTRAALRRLASWSREGHTADALRPLRAARPTPGGAQELVRLGLDASAELALRVAAIRALRRQLTGEVVASLAHMVAQGGDPTIRAAAVSVLGYGRTLPARRAVRLAEAGPGPLARAARIARARQGPVARQVPASPAARSK